MGLSLLMEVLSPVFLKIWYQVEVDCRYNVPVPKDTSTGTHWKGRLDRPQRRLGRGGDKKNFRLLR